jgi:hypothetical protein
LTRVNLGNVHCYGLGFLGKRGALVVSPISQTNKVCDVYWWRIKSSEHLRLQRFCFKTNIGYPPRRLLLDSGGQLRSVTIFFFFLSLGQLLSTMSVSLYGLLLIYFM